LGRDLELGSRRAPASVMVRPGCGCPLAIYFPLWPTPPDLGHIEQNPKGLVTLRVCLVSMVDDTGLEPVTPGM
jgi:hypothetical protein